MKVKKSIDPFQFKYCLISTISQLTGFYMKCNSRLKGLKAIRLKLFPCNNCCILSLCSFKKQQSVTGVSATTFSFSTETFCAAIFQKYLRKLLLQKKAKVVNSI